MSKRDYKKLEDHIINICNNNKNITFKGVNYELSKADRPIVQGKGECKTDVLIRLYKSASNPHDFTDITISIKQSNAEFLANKLKPVDAENLFGENWKNIVSESIKSIKTLFNEKNLLIESTKNGRGYTLGWRLEVANKPRTLSSKIQIPKNEIIDVIYKGKSLSDDKKNAFVFGKQVENSGIANYLLEGNIENFISIDDVLSKIQCMDSLSANDVYLIYTASNYYPNKSGKKIEGNRHLAVYVNWDVVSDKLTPTIIYDEPLKNKGVDDVLPALKAALSLLPMK